MMKNSVKSLLVAAAVTGLLGATAVPAAAEDPKPATTQTEKDKHSCKGANGCSGKAAEATDKDKHSCKGANGCSGKDATKKAAKKSDKKAEKNSCKGANGCSSKEEKKN